MSNKPQDADSKQPDSSFIQLDDAKQKGAASAASAPRRKDLLGVLTAAAPLSSKTIHTVLEHLLFFAVPFLPVITVLAVELVTGERLWCRWGCPQSVLLALMARLTVAPRLRRTLYRCTCKGEHACRRACSLGLDPRNPRSASPLECTNCGACVLACSRVHGGGPAALALG